MTSSKFKVVPCELSDMSECVDIFDEVFATDPTMLYFHPRSDSKVLKEKSLSDYEKSYMAPETRHFKAIHEESGEVAAFSKWIYPHTPDPTDEDPETAIRNEPQVPGLNDELIIESRTKFLRERRKWFVPETHYFMGILAVRQKYQRKSIGSMLLAPVLQLADRDNAKTFVQASVQGLGLYLKHGWVEVDEIVLDFSPYGGPKEARTALMIREPRSGKVI